MVWYVSTYRINCFAARPGHHSRDKDEHLWHRKSFHGTVKSCKCKNQRRTKVPQY